MSMPAAALRALVAALVLTPATLAAFDGDWTPAGKQSAGAVFVDAMSIQRERDQVAFAARIDLAQAGRLARGGRPFRSVVVEARAKCGAQQFATGRTAYFALPGARGDKVGEFAAPPETRHFAPVPPSGSPERMMFDFVCAGSKRS